MCYTAKTSLAALLLLVSMAAIGQKEYDKWYFGNKAGIDFASGTAVPLTNGAMTLADNSGVISDSVGNLLFYTNGVTVWNRNHAIMPNGSGLQGNVSAGHTATIVRRPGSHSVYFVITVDAFAYPNGLEYSVVDMSLNGGLGDVVTGQKNISLLAVASEQVVPVVHANGQDIWIVAHDWGNDHFVAYLVTNAGINTVPVISAIGNNRSGGGNNALGQITVSPDNTKIAAATFGNSTWELFDFNNATGMLSNRLLFTGYTNAWGLEFSPDNSRIYLNGWTTQYVYQFSLATYTQAAINSSMVNLGNVSGPTGPYHTGYMQRAPDGKIYMAVYNDPYAAVINTPNAPGTACNLVDDGFYLGGKTNVAGLVDKVVVTDICTVSVELGNDTALCTGQSRLLDATNSGASYSWSNGATSPTLNVTTPGVYSVTVTALSGCTATDTVSVSYTNTPAAFSLGPDTAYCGSFSRTLSTGIAGTSWSTGATAPQITVASAGVYWAQVSNGCGTATDSVTIIQNTIPAVNLGPDTTLCQGNTLLLQTNNPGAIYHWQDNTTGSTYNVTTSGTYAVTVTNASGCTGSDAITVAYTSGPPLINIGPDTAYCGSFSRTLSTGNAGTNWSTGVTAPQITVTTAGVYWAQVSNGCGTATDSITIIQNTIPAVNLGPDTTLCQGNTLLLQTNNPGAIYHWQDNTTGSTYNVTTSGTYAVTVTNASGCTGSDAITVAYTSGPPLINIGPDTAYCGSFSRTLSTGNAGTNWSTGVTAPQITVATAGVYWAQVSNGCGTATDSITIIQNTIPAVNLGPDTTLCQGNTLLLQTNNPGAIYHWQDNAAGSSSNVTTSGTYAVTVTNASGCTAWDDINISYDAQPPVVILGNDSTFCSSINTVITIGIQNTLWSTGTTAPQITVTTPGVYWASITNACGTSADTLGYNLVYPPAVTLGSDTSICNGESILVQSFGGGSHLLWSTGETTPSIMVTQPGTYWLQAWDSSNCRGTDSIIIEPGTPPAVNLGSDTIICGESALLLHVPISNVHFQWQDNSIDSIYYVTSTGTYSVTVSNNCGSTTASKKVEMHTDACLPYIPTAFSPNNDDVNDLLHVISFCPVEKLLFRVYNRWGEKVFEAKDVMTGWDGIYKGARQPLGTFVYYLEYYNYCKGGMDKVAGNVTLVR